VEEQGVLTTSQRDQDRLVTLRKAKKKLITQRQAAEEVGVNERQVRRMLKCLRKEGDKPVMQRLRAPVLLIDRHPAAADGT